MEELQATWHRGYSFKVSFRKEHKILSFVCCVWFKQLTVYSLVWLLGMFKEGGPNYYPMWKWLWSPKLVVCSHTEIVGGVMYNTNQWQGTELQEGQSQCSKPRAGLNRYFLKLCTEGRKNNYHPWYCLAWLKIDEDTNQNLLKVRGNLLGGDFQNKFLGLYIVQGFCWADYCKCNGGLFGITGKVQLSFTEQMLKLIMCLQRQHLGRKEAMTGRTETLVYVVPGILYIGAVRKLCYICYPEHRKTALIWFKEQIMTHSEVSWYCHCFKDIF